VVAPASARGARDFAPPSPPPPQRAPRRARCLDIHFLELRHPRLLAQLGAPGKILGAPALDIVSASTCRVYAVGAAPRHCGTRPGRCRETHLPISRPMSLLTPSSAPAQMRGGCTRDISAWRTFAVQFCARAPPPSRCSPCCASSLGTHFLELHHLDLLVLLCAPVQLLCAPARVIVRAACRRVCDQFARRATARLTLHAVVRLTCQSCGPGACWPY
jgi:hypothetical protein